MPERPDRPAAATRREAVRLHDDSKFHARVLWLVAVIWNLLCWPVAVVVWASAGWSVGSFFVGLFPFAGLLLVWAAIAASVMVNRFRGTVVTTVPAEARIGEPLGVRVSLPARRVVKKRQRQFELRLTENRIRDDDSDPAPHEEWMTRLAPVVQVHEDGSGYIEAEFLIPAFCEPTDKIIDGERVLWLLELIDLSNADVQKFDLPVVALQAIQPDQVAPVVQPIPIASVAGITAGRRWSRAGKGSRTPAPIPYKVMRVTEYAGSWAARFPAAAYRALGALLLIPTCAAFWSARLDFLGESSIDSLAALLWVLAGWIGLGLCLHFFSKTWKLRITQHGIRVERSSLLRTNRVLLANGDLVDLLKKRVYRLPDRSADMRYQIHAVTRSGGRLQLTPPIATESMADAVADTIRQAQANYANLFAPLQQDAAATRRRRDAGLASYLLLALFCAGLVGLPPDYVPGDPVNPLRVGQDWAIRLQRLTPSGLLHEDLLATQERGDLAALEALLKQGVNPNTVLNTGSSLLMLAAQRGNVAHVDLLLRYGADVNQRDETSSKNRGDSALLTALRAGHEMVVRRLLEVGARLDVRTMWDLTPMHMAAQGNCIPCLNLLLEKGQSINPHADAGRGETPAMLAAARGQLEALQWFAVHGVDLNERDADGKTALDWAVFFNKQNTAEWIQQNMR